MSPIWNNYSGYRAELGNEKSCFDICLKIMVVLFSNKTQTKRPTKNMCIRVADQQAAVI